MAKKPTQKTQPKGSDKETGKLYEPVDIPVPKREDFDRLLKRAARGSEKPPPK